MPQTRKKQRDASECEHAATVDALWRRRHAGGAAHGRDGRLHAHVASLPTVRRTARIDVDSSRPVARSRSRRDRAHLGDHDVAGEAEPGPVRVGGLRHRRQRQLPGPPRLGARRPARDAACGPRRRAYGAATGSPRRTARRRRARKSYAGPAPGRCGSPGRCVRRRRRTAPAAPGCATGPARATPSRSRRSARPGTCASAASLDRIRSSAARARDRVPAGERVGTPGQLGREQVRAPARPPSVRS